MNYRSAILHGTVVPFGSFSHEKGKELTLKGQAFKCIIETALPGRWDYARQPNEEEIRGTGIIR